MPYPGLRLKNERYELVSILRRGGAGVVWRALDRTQGSEIALKALPLEGGGLQAMEREAEAALRVKHPAVLAPRDTFVDADHAWIALELCAGSVSDAVDERGPLTTDAAVGLLIEPLAALAAAHAVGVVHRDVKPSNLLIRADGSVLLADFGIARMLADARALTRSSAMLGSLPYMAPEQRRDPRDVSPATDVYAAAATLVTLLTGEPAGDLFAAGVAQRLEAVDVPAALREAILRAGAYEASDRPSDAGALRSALRAACPDAAPPTAWVPSGRDWRTGDADATRLPASAAPPSGPARAAPRSSAIAVVAVAGTLASVAALGGGVWIGLRDDVRARVVTEPALVGAARAVAATPTCATPSTWVHSAAPQREVHPDGLREATGYPLVRDLDGDGHADLTYIHNASEAVRIYWGNADGALDAEHPQDVPAQRGFGRVVLADLDGNGLADPVWKWVDGLHYLPRTGPRTFDPVQHIEEVESIEQIAAGDVDRDGRDDLVLALRDNALFLRRGDGRGGLGTLSQMGITASNHLLADVVGDPGVDLITAESGRLLLREGLPGGELGPPTDIGAVPLSEVLGLGAHRRGDRAWIAASGGVDRLGVFATPARVVRYDARPDGGWEPCLLRELFQRSGTVADFDGDDAPDVLTAFTCGYCTSEYAAWVAR